MKSMNINIIHKLESLEADWKKIQTQIHSPPHTTTQDPKEIMQSLIEQQLKGVRIHVREIMSDEWFYRLPDYIQYSIEKLDTDASKVLMNMGIESEKIQHVHILADAFGVMCRWVGGNIENTFVKRILRILHPEKYEQMFTLRYRNSLETI